MRDRSRVGCVIDPNRLERCCESSEVEAFQWVLKCVKCVYACVYIVVFVWVCLCVFGAAQNSIPQFLFPAVYLITNHPHQTVD